MLSRCPALLCLAVVFSMAACREDNPVALDFAAVPRDDPAVVTLLTDQPLWLNAGVTGRFAADYIDQICPPDPQDATIRHCVRVVQVNREGETVTSFDGIMSLAMSVAPIDGEITLKLYNLARDPLPLFLTTEPID